MKKLLAIVLALTFVLGMVACTQPEETVDPNKKSEGVMTYAEYDAAKKDDAVVIEAFVQAKQSWWDNKATIYLQDGEGAYFVYEMVCSEEDYAKLTVGTKIKVEGFKTEWAGEIEIASGATFTFVDTEDTWVATAMDATALLGTDDLIKHQNKLVKFTDMTVVSVAYKNGQPGDDIYVTLSKGDALYDFCVEYYLTGDDTDVYKAVGALKAGDVVEVEGFLYWYNAVNTHITAVKVVAEGVDPNKKSEGVMTYAQYDAAAKDDAVVIEAFVQAKQSWWDNKATIYLQDGEGAYFVYEMVCSEDDYAKLTVGTKIKVEGYKTEWAGEIELASGATFTFVDTEDKWVATAMDATALLGTEDLIKHQNKLVKFTDMTVVSIEYKNGQPGDDIYVKLSKGEAEYDFCVEYYLTGDDTAVYAAVGALKAGDVIDVEGFLYWYNAVNTHITGVTKK